METGPNCEDGITGFTGGKTGLICLKCDGGTIGSDHDNEGTMTMWQLAQNEGEWSRLSLL